MTPALMAHVKQARKRYFSDQEKRASAKVRSEKDGKLEAINAEIASFNQKINLLDSTIKMLREKSVECMFNAEKQDSHAAMKSALTESCSLKRAASDKEKDMDNIVAKKQKLMQKKKDLK